MELLSEQTNHVAQKATQNRGHRMKTRPDHRTEPAQVLGSGFGILLAALVNVTGTAEAIPSPQKYNHYGQSPGRY